VAERAAARARRSAQAPWVPYLVPYAAFLLIQEIQARPIGRDSLVLWLLRVVVPFGLFLHYLRQGAFPELRRFRPTLLGVGSDVAVGLGVTLLWVAPYVLGWLPGPEAGRSFDPDQLGHGLREVVLGLRLLGFAAVTPFVEELFVRSFLVRASELVSFSGLRLEIDERRDWREIPIGAFSVWSFAVTVLYFALSHTTWEWPVAAATGVIYNLWLMHRREIGALVVTHAVTNASLFALVALGSGHLPGPGGAPLVLWYFL